MTEMSLIIAGSQSSLKLSIPTKLQPTVLRRHSLGSGVTNSEGC